MDDNIVKIKTLNRPDLLKSNNLNNVDNIYIQFLMSQHSTRITEKYSPKFEETNISF